MTMTSTTSVATTTPATATPSTTLKTTTLIAALLAAGAIGGAGVSAVSTLHGTATAQTASATTSVAPITSATTLPDFPQITQRYGPAVVNISVVSDGKASADEVAQADLDEDDGPAVAEDPFQEFFRRFQQGPGHGQGRSAPSEQITRGQGSGFIVSPDGIILTNAHVVKGAKEVTVKLTDRREFRAKVLGADPKTDVAVLRIEANNLPVVQLGKVADLRVGEWVLAIGSPFGFENTVTAGVVSAKGRSLPDDSAVPFIQTDVPINPGNSGGPLFNARGEVVGINSQIYSRSGGFMGISFAIPIDEASRVAEQLRLNGRVIRGRIGVTIAPVTKEVAESIDLGAPRGALVQGVEKDQAADKAGVEAGDIILRVDGKPVDKSADLPRLVGGIKPGTKIALQVFRRGTTKDLSVVVSEFEADRPTRRVMGEPGAVTPPAAVKSALGLSVSDLTDAQKKELRVRGGVRVDAAEGAAARAGLREGDIILALNNVDVMDSKQFQTASGKLDKAKAATVMVRRGEWVNYIVIKPAK